MPWSIQNYTTTPAANAVVNGVDISDKTGLPGNMNNAMRQVMADVRESALCHPELNISGDADNALKLGSDGKLHAAVKDIAAGTPAQLISQDDGNKMTTGSDGRLKVTREAVLAMPWAGVTGAPANFAPVLHAPTHGPGGSDPIPTFFPSGAIALWAGKKEDIPPGWLLCDGFGGTPDLRDYFIGGAGLSAAPMQGGGYNSQTVGFTTGGGTIVGQDAHNHELRGTTRPVSKNYDAASGVTDLVFQLGYAPATVSQALKEISSAWHTHPVEMTAYSRPPHIALYYIMKQ